MRKDWDYVSMGDYSRDMEELSSMASAAVEAKSREARDLKILHQPPNTAKATSAFALMTFEPTARR